MPRISCTIEKSNNYNSTINYIKRVKDLITRNLRIPNDGRVRNYIINRLDYIINCGGYEIFRWRVSSKKDLS